MARNTDRLPRVIALTTYADMKRWLNDFVAGHYNLLFSIGRPGISKSQLAMAALGDRRHAWVEGHATPLAFYQKLFEHRDEPVVIDDEYSFVQDKSKLSLVNSLCQTNPVKKLRWDSTARILEERGIPTEFQTTSSVLVITNELRNISTQTAAMLNRGQPLIFRPSAAEIHDEVANWFTDKEIHGFIGEWLKFIPDLSMRDYVKALQMKKAGRQDWRELLQKQWKCSRLARVAGLRADPSFPTEEARVQAFIALGWSRATYFRDLDRLARLAHCRASPDEDELVSQSHDGPSRQPRWLFSYLSQTYLINPFFPSGASVFLFGWQRSGSGQLIDSTFAVTRHSAPTTNGNPTTMFRRHGLDGRQTGHARLRREFKIKD